MEIRDSEDLSRFVKAQKELGTDGTAVLEGNVQTLLPT